MAPKAFCPPEVLKRPENQKCADCQAHNPDWASVKLGVILCTTCAGIHRKLGTHISFVRSTSLDEWTLEQIEVVKNVGNAKANAYYEHNVPAGSRYTGVVALAGADKIDPDTARKLESWIRDKYEHKKFAPPGLDEPYVRVKRGEKIKDPGGGSTSEEKKSKKNKKEDKEKNKRRQEQYEQPQQQQQDMSYGGAYPGGAPSPMYPDPNYGGQGMMQPGMDMYGGGGPAGMMQPGMDMYGGGGPAAMMPYNGVPPNQQMFPDAGGMGQAMQPGGGSGGQGAMAPGAYGAPTAPAPGVAPNDPAVADAERRAALQSISQILASPQSLGINEQFLMPYGLNLQAAEFDPAALKRPRSGMGSVTPTSAFGTNQSWGASMVPQNGVPRVANEAFSNNGWR